MNHKENPSPAAPSPITNSLSWTGKQMQEDPSWQIILPQQCIDELINTTLTLIKDTKQPTFSYDYLQSIKLTHFAHFYNELQIANFLEQGMGIVRITGFPYHDCTPQQLELAFLLLGHAIGMPVAQNIQGQTLTHVKDEGFKLGQPRARGINTRDKLKFHTDSCDITAMLCLKKAKEGAISKVISSVNLHNSLLEQNPEWVKTLYQAYYLESNHSWDVRHDTDLIPMPIFSQSQGYFSSKYLEDYILRPQKKNQAPRLSTAQIAALDAIDAFFDDPSQSIIVPFEPGDIMLVNNHIAYHSRTEFEDFLEPDKKRHLLRVWLACPKSRPLAQAYLPYMRNLEAGTLRGGVDIAQALYLYPTTTEKNANVSN